MELLSFVGGCVPLFLLAVAFDVIGLILLFLGIFANLRIDGRFYGDFLIYTGSLVIFFSLGFWLMWYVGNVQVSGDDGAKKRDSVVAVLARKLSERLSQKLRAEPRVKSAEGAGRGRGGVAAPTASRVTWGKSAAYNNEGYEGSLDPPAEGRVEAGPGEQHKI